MTKSMKPKSLARAACALGLGLAICAGAPTAAFAEYLGFPDVNPTDWYASTVEWATENHVINGSNGMWDPAGVVNRGMAATILHNYSGDPAPAEDATFADADTFGWAGSGIAWAQDKGVFNGYGGAYGNFGPWDTLTREQAACVLYNMLGKGEKVDTSAMNGFADASRVSAWARDGVAWATYHKIMGQGGTISPTSTCTRAEFVTMLLRVTKLSAAGDDNEKPGDEQKPGGGDDTEKPGAGDDEKPGTGDDQKPEEKPGDDDDEKDPDQGGDQGGTTNPGGGDQGGSTTDPGEGDEKPQEPTGSYDLSDGTWTFAGVKGSQDGYYGNAFYYDVISCDSAFNYTTTRELYNADLANDVASVTGRDGTSLKQGVNFDVSRTWNESAKTITTTFTGINGTTGSHTVTESVRNAMPLFYAPFTCQGKGKDAIRYADGNTYVAYVAINNSGRTNYEGYTMDYDLASLNGRRVSDVVCDWYTGAPDLGDAILSPTNPNLWGTGEIWATMKKGFLKTEAYCTNPSCPKGHYTSPITNTMGLSTTDVAQMAVSGSHGNLKDTPVIPINLN